MAARGIGQTITLTAWNTADNEPRVADAANVTLRLIRDGVAGNPGNAPADVENGEISLELTAGETDCAAMTIEGTSATEDTIIVPVRITFEARLDSPPGASTLTATVEDGDSAAAPGQSGTIWNEGQSAKIVEWVYSDENGVLRMQGGGLPGLDDGTYKVVLQSSAGYSFANPYTIVVSGATSETLTCTQTGLPEAADPDECRVYEDFRLLDGSLVGEREARLTIAERLSPQFLGAAGDEGYLAAEKAEIELGWTDGSGRAYRDLLRGIRVSMRIATPEGERDYTITVPDAASERLSALVGSDNW